MTLDDPSPLLAALRDAAEGLRQAREDMRAAHRCSTGLATIAIEQELEQMSAQVIRVKRMVESVTMEEL